MHTFYSRCKTLFYLLNKLINISNNLPTSHYYVCANRINLLDKTFKSMSFYVNTGSSCILLFQCTEYKSKWSANQLWKKTYPNRNLSQQKTYLLEQLRFIYYFIWPFHAAVYKRIKFGWVCLFSLSCFFFFFFLRKATSAKSNTSLIQCMYV